MSKCKPCLGTEIKGAILETFPGLGELLEEIPTCEQDTDIEFCLNEPREMKTGKKKRAPSKYNLHIKQCLSTKDLKGKPFGTAGKYMRECAQSWHEKGK